VDQELLDNERVPQGDDGIKSSNDQDIRQNGRESQKETGAGGNKEQDSLVGVLSTTVNHYWPKFNEWLQVLRDRRDQESIDYKRETIVWVALILMLTKQGSRKKLSDQRRTAAFVENVKNLSGQEDLENIPHGDTVEYFTVRARVEEFEELGVKMMRQLFRGRVLERYRVLGRYHTIAIDGYHAHTFDYEHCDHCLVKEDAHGNKRWFHYKLQASLVTPTGLCLPMTSEWIENEKDYDKQDCELRAVYRLIKQLRRFYPQLPMCIVLDGLYARQTVFAALKEQRMEWIVVFKQGVMPEAFEWVMDCKQRMGNENVMTQREEKEIDVRNKRCHQDKLMRSKPKNKKRTVIKETTYTWMNAVQHWDGKRSFNIMSCQEVEDGQTNCDYVWLVSDGLGLSPENVVQLTERGRCRWKIENEGINTLKNGGYHLKHLYSRDEVSLKVWHAILNIAHLINQLIEKGSLIAVKTYGSIRNIAIRMFEHFRYFVFKKPAHPPRIQIRLTWDTS
jgi:hypothetical protein